MTRLFRAGILLLAFCLKLAVPPGVAGQTNQSAVSDKTTSESPINAVPLKPGPDDGPIALTTAVWLERLHYTHRHFDDALSSEFLDRYLNALDPLHLHFLQSDLNQFESYRTNLDNLTLRKSGADTTPAYEIFSRYLERQEQRVNYMTNALAHEKFTFNSDDRIEVDRRKEPYPKDLNEAKQLWHQRLRYDYLQEKLTREEAQKTSTNKTESASTMDQDIVKLLTRRYTLNLHSFKELDASDVLEIYLNTLAHVYDPHSDYMGRKQFENFAILMNLSLTGIGAQLRSVDGYCTIDNLVPGGPAAKSKKLKEKDRIVAVAQSNQPPVDVVDVNLPKVVDMIRGPIGTEVRLTVIPVGESESKRVEVTLIRDKINLDDQAAKAEIIDLPLGKGEPVRLGVIILPTFYAPVELNGPKPPDSTLANTNKLSPGKYTSVDVAKLLTKFKHEKVQGVILDLRNNGGGSLDEAVKLTGLFIKKGPVVQVRDWDGKAAVLDDTDPDQLYGGPLIVLINHFTASASEILAGALQDYGRALIVGESSTHGKGTVQAVEPLQMFMRSEPTNDPGKLKVTIRKFYRPGGASTQLTGVLPDIVLPSIFNYSKDVGEKALENPLPPGEPLMSAKYEKFNLVEPYLSELLKHSTGRVATNQDFVYVCEDIEKFRKMQADKTFSLNEQQRLKEMQEDEARNKARDKERLARKESNEKVYEITLKQSDLPGLPPPVQHTNSLALNADHPFNPVSVTWTNSADAKQSDQKAVAEEIKPPAVDAELDETEHILVDYLSLLQKTNTLIANQNGKGL